MFICFINIIINLLINNILLIEGTHINYTYQPTGTKEGVDLSILYHMYEVHICMYVLVT